MRCATAVFPEGSFRGILDVLVVNNDTHTIKNMNLQGPVPDT
jgi:hypothetical protein